MSWTSFPELTQVASHGDDLIFFETAGTPENKYQKRSVFAAWLLANMNAALAAFFGLTFANDKGVYATGASAFATYDLTAGGRALGGVAGTADTLPYFSAANTVSLAPITAAARALLDDADAAAMRTTLGLVIGTDVQAYSAALTEFAGYSITSTFNILLNSAAIPGFFSTVTTAPLMMARAGSGTVAYVFGEGTTGYNAGRYDNSAGAPTFRGYKSRGSMASPSVVLVNDRVVSVAGSGWDGSAFQTAAELYVILIAATPSATDMEAEYVVSLCPAGSVTNSRAFSFSHRHGMRMGTGNAVVIDANRHFTLRAYTVATLPSAATANQMIAVGDGSSNRRLAISDGTNWRWADGTIVS